MPGERLTLDPVLEFPTSTEDTTRVPLELADNAQNGVPLALLEHSYPTPDLDSQFAGTADTEGDPLIAQRHKNREITLKLRAHETNGTAPTNLATNPSGEVTKKLVNGPDFVITRIPQTDTVQAPTGDYIDQHVYDGAGSDTNTGSLAFTFPASGTYTVSVYVWIPSAWNGGTLSIATDGSYTGSSQSQITADLAKRDQWQRISTTITIAADAVGSLVVRCASMPTTGGTGTFYSDALQIEEASAASEFFCGDTAGCAWTGTRHSSTSTRPAIGGPRLYAVLRDVQKTVDKINRSGGVLRRVPPSGEPVVFDLLTAKVEVTSDLVFARNHRADVTLTFTAEPFGRLEPQVFGTKSDTTDPVLEFTETAVGGDVPGLMRLTLTDTSGASRQFAIWGIESENYSSSADAGILYQAETRTILGSEGSTGPADGATGASGTAPNVIRGPLNLGTEITNVTNVVNPTITTSTSHGLAAGDPIHISGVLGATGVNGKREVTSAPTGTTFTITTAAPGAYTAGSGNVLRGLGATYTALMSTQASGGGNHLTHVGDFQVFARVYIPPTNTGGVSIRFSWAQGRRDGRLTTNPEVALYPASTPEALTAWNGTWRLVDLGQVHLSKIASGPHRWEGVVEAASTANADILDLDYLLLIPVSEGSGRASVPTTFAFPSVPMARDAPDLSSGGTLDTNRMPGATGAVVWDSFGDADDFSFGTFGADPTITRGAVNDTTWLTGRVATAVVSQQGAFVQCDFLVTGMPEWGINSQFGVVLRCDGSMNEFAAFTYPGTPSGLNPSGLALWRVIGGVQDQIEQMPTGFAAIGNDAWYTFRFVIDAAGRYYGWFYPAGSVPGDPQIIGFDSAFVTSVGALGDGRPGIIDFHGPATTPTRHYRNFYAGTATADLVLATNQSLEIRETGAIREDTSGTFYFPVSRYAGDLGRVPPGRREGRTLRVVAKATESDPAVFPQSASGVNLQGQLTVIPRVLVVG